MLYECHVFWTHSIFKGIAIFIIRKGMFCFTYTLFIILKNEDKKRGSTNASPLILPWKNYPLYASTPCSATSRPSFSSSSSTRTPIVSLITKKMINDTTNANPPIERVPIS